jgi:hypothetical protein
MKKKQYTRTVERKLNKNCKVEFKTTSTGDIHIKIFTFDNKPIVLKEKTFYKLMLMYPKIKSLIGLLNDSR